MVENQKTQYILNGFSQIGEFRVFAFERISADWSRLGFTVRTNLALTRRYGIRLQELPLLCRTVLEQRPEGETQREFAFTEEDMCLHTSEAAARAVEAKKRRKPPRPPVSSHVGAAWRASSR